MCLSRLHMRESQIESVPSNAEVVTRECAQAGATPAIGDESPGSPNTGPETRSGGRAQPLERMSATLRKPSVDPTRTGAGAEEGGAPGSEPPHECRYVEPVLRHQIQPSAYPISALQ